MTAPEFSRPIRIETVGSEPQRLNIAADEAERAALARRFSLVEIRRLEAAMNLTRDGAEMKASGSLSAEVVQSCVASGEPIPQSVAESFDLVFRPAPPAGQPEEEVELSAAELDLIFYEGGAVDVGEAVAETLSLSLDPYPRAAGAQAALKAAGVRSEEEAGPFGALAALRDKMRK